MHHTVEMPMTTTSKFQIAKPTMPAIVKAQDGEHIVAIAVAILAPAMRASAACVALRSGRNLCAISVRASRRNTIERQHALSRCATCADGASHRHGHC
jgi:hypothetical protein